MTLSCFITAVSDSCLSLLLGFEELQVFNWYQLDSLWYVPIVFLAQFYGKLYFCLYLEKSGFPVFCKPWGQNPWNPWCWGFRCITAACTHGNRQSSPWETQHPWSLVSGITVADWEYWCCCDQNWSESLVCDSLLFVETSCLLCLCPRLDCFAKTRICIRKPASGTWFVPIYAEVSCKEYYALYLF